MPIYSGVGSRETPDQILKLMEDIAVVLAQRGWVLRSGLVGGTAQAMRIAKHLEIPIFNLFFDDHINKLNEFILQMN